MFSPRDGPARDHRRSVLGRRSAIIALNITGEGAGEFIVIAAKLVELIEIHASSLTTDIAQDLFTNERTPGFRAVRPQELEHRIVQLLNRLGNWIGDPRSEKTRTEFSDWGRRRFDQGIPLSELIYAVIIIKQHLRRYISDNGLVDAAFPRMEGDYVLPLHLQSLHDLHVLVGQFFDEALYHLAIGYEDRSGRSPR